LSAATQQARIRFFDRRSSGGRQVISEEEMRHVADLARLGLTDEEIKRAASS
jgi:hypothetical protein